MNTRINDIVRTFRALNPKHGFQSRLVFADAQRKSVSLKAAVEGPVCELYMYDVIGSDMFGSGITASAVTECLKADGASAKTLNIYINSPGGSVFEATAIYNVIKRFPGAKNVYVDGLAASAASYVAMVGDSICTAPNALWMIHNPWGYAMGNADDLRATADTLDKVKSVMVEVYAERSGMKADEVSALLDKETWMTADEAVKYGFSDKVEDPHEEAKEPGEPIQQGEQMSSELKKAILALMQQGSQPQPKADSSRARESVESMAKRTKDIKRGQPRTSKK